jgi:hypothetical protein
MYGPQANILQWRTVCDRRAQVRVGCIDNSTLRVLAPKKARSRVSPDHHLVTTHLRQEHCTARHGARTGHDKVHASLGITACGSGPINTTRLRHIVCWETLESLQASVLKPLARAPGWSRYRRQEPPNHKSLWETHSTL